MSHYTTIRIRIRDAAALREVLERRGYSVREDGGNLVGQKAGETLHFEKQLHGFLFETSRDREDRRLRQKGASLKRDVEKLKREQKAEAEAQRLQQEYAVAKVREQISLRGLNIIDEEQAKDGTVRMVIQV